jgi:hypothetical protein
MLVIQNRFKKIGVRNLVVRRIFSDILLVLGLKKVEKYCNRPFSGRHAEWTQLGLHPPLCEIKKKFIFADFTLVLIHHHHHHHHHHRHHQ